MYRMGIATSREPRSEHRVRDQRPGRSSGIEFCGDVLQQIVDLGYVAHAVAELDVPDLVRIHAAAIAPLAAHGDSRLPWSRSKL
jgi:hypothetical protein